MTGHALTINAGSSSIKIALFDLSGEAPTERMSGLIERIGGEPHVKAKSAETDERTRKAIAATMDAMTALVERAKNGEAYDQMIGESNEAGNKVVDAAITGLIGQTKEFERAIAALELQAVQFEGSDSLDDPSKVLQ